MHQRDDTRIRVSVTYSLLNILLAVPAIRNSRFLPRKDALSGDARELVPEPWCPTKEDARNLTSLRARRRSPGVLEQPPGNRRRKISVPSLRESRGAVQPRRKSCGGV